MISCCVLAIGKESTAFKSILAFKIKLPWGGEKQKSTSSCIGKRHLKSLAPEGSGVWVLYLCPTTHGRILHFEISSKNCMDFDGFCVRSFVLFLLSYWGIPLALLTIV